MFSPYSRQLKRRQMPNIFIDIAVRVPHLALLLKIICGMVSLFSGSVIVKLIPL